MSDRDERGTVVVCAYTLERLDDTLAAVRSVLGQVPQPARTVVVVDHNDELLERLRAELPASVLVVPNAERRGLSGARNTGVAHAVGPVVAFLDDDATADPGWLSGLLGPFEDPQVLAAGGVALPAWDGRRPGWFPEEYLWVVGCSYRGMRTRGPVRNVLGCNMAFRASVLAEIGGFDAAVGRLGTLPLGAEETELCIRARRRHPGGVVLAVEGAVVRHRVPAGRQGPRYFLRRCFYEGVSKAILVRLSDGEALASERDYTARTLPAGLARAFSEVLRLEHPRDAAGRALAIVAGVVAAGAGFVLGTLLDRRRRAAAPGVVGRQARDDRSAGAADRASPVHAETRR